MPESIHTSVRHLCQDIKRKAFVVKMKKFFLYFSAILMLLSFDVKAANETFTSGAFIINMGVTPQTVANGLKPYGLIYDLIKNNDVPIKWVIGQGKVKDGIDFTHNGISYRGGTFIILAEYRSAAVNAKIATWQAKGVVGATSVSSMTLNVTTTLQAVPNWAMDARNGGIAIEFLEAAEIPASAYYYRTPATLNACDNLYVMPHADPKWSTHSNLYFWNKNNRGAIWGGCHAVSVMEGPACVNPLDSTQNLKFLSTNGLVDFRAHNNGTPPYSYAHISDPVYQFMGLEDAAHQGGSEQIFLPLKTVSAWNPSVKIGCFDPTQSDIPSNSDGLAALTAYGYAFNDTTRGVVMYEGGHNIGGTTPANVAAQRIFFNWSFIGASNKEPRSTYSNIPTKMNSNVMYPNFTVVASSPVGSTAFTYQWSSTLGGVFTAPTSSVTNYTAPAVLIPTIAKIICKVTDNCGRYSLTEFSVVFMPPPEAPYSGNDTINFPDLCSASTQTINVLLNDYDVNMDMNNSITFLGGGNYGTFTDVGNGNVSYTPGWLFQGSDTMRYEVCDSSALCDQSTIVITSDYSGPCSIITYLKTDTARADTVQFNQAVTNPNNSLGYPDQADGSNTNSARFDSDNDSLILRLDNQINTGDTVQFRIASDNASCVDFTVMGALTSGGFVPGVNSLNGTISAGTTRIYSWFNLIVTGSTRYVKIKIRATACDNKLNLDAVRANFRYCASNIPVATLDNAVTAANVSIITNVKVNDTDPQGGALSVSIVDAPNNGSAGVNGAGNIVYTPDSAFFGADTLIYKICNSSCLCDTAFVIYDVQTHPPCGAGLPSYYRNGNATSVTSSTGVTNPNQGLGIPDAANGSNNFTAEINSSINNNIVFDLTDTVYAGDTIVVRMAPDNNNANTIRVQGNLTNAWGSPSTSTDFNLPASNGKIYANYNFILAGNARFIRIIQINSNDKVDVDALSYDYWYCGIIPNSPPIANNDTVSTPVNRPVYMAVKANDEDPDVNPITHSIINPAAANGSASISGVGILYTPDFGFTGIDTVNYQICDNGSPSLCDSALFIITVLPGPPVAMVDNSTVNSNSFIIKAVQANDTLAVNNYSYTTSLLPLVLPPTNGTAILVGNSIQYTPNANFTGIDSLVYQICDNGSPVACDSAMFYVTVTNLSPVANDDTITTSACNAVIINVADNDTDPESGTLIVSSVSVPSNGTAVISNNQIVYTPSSSPVFTGVEVFNYFVCDNGFPSVCDSATIRVTVNSVNPPSNPPNAVDDADTTYVNQDIFITVLANDSDPDNDSLVVDSTATGLLLPSNGTMYYLPNNQIRYVPNVGITAIDTLEYQVCDIHNNGTGCINILPSCSIAQVIITILNRTPALNDENAYTINTVAISNSVATNDFEPDGQPLTYTLLNAPAFGGIVFNTDGSYTYTPDGISTGIFDLEYVACDNAAVPLCDTAVLHLMVDITNVPPNAFPDSVLTIGITPVVNSVATNDMDPNGNIDPNGFTLLSGGNNGTLVFDTTGGYTFVADTGFFGIEYIFYEVCDLGTPALCATSTLIIEVVKGAPNTVNENDTVNEDGFLNVLAGSGILSNGDTDPNGIDLTVTTSLVLNPVNGNAVVWPDGRYTYTPFPNYEGTDFFIVSVCNDSSTAASICTNDTIFLTVLPVNDPPVLDNETISTNEDTPFSGDLTDAGDSDPDGTVLTANTVPVVAPTNGSIIVNANGTYTYTPNLNYNGTDLAIINICDAGTPMPSSCKNDTIFITVTPFNDPPVIDNETISTNEDTSVNGDLTDAGDSDPDGTALTANTVPVVAPTNGSILVNANGTYTYTPNLNFNGTDLIVVNICDAGTPMPASCVNDTIFITVDPVNDTPVIDNESINVDENKVFSGDLTNAGDFDPDTTVLTANTVPVIDVTNGVLVVNANGTYSYTPNLNYNGPDTAIISICDAGNPMPAICVNDTIFITVAPYNDPPVLDNEIISTNEDTPFSGDLTDAGDFDPDTTALTANTVPILAPTNGSIIVNADGTYTYTPNLNFNGTDLVVINICDGGTPAPDSCGNDTIFITVNPVNDSAVVDNENISTNEDTPVNGDLTDAGDSDIDTTALTANTVPVVAPVNGSIIVNANGTYTYTPNSDFNGTDLAVVSICDAGTPMPSICVNDTIFITVNPVNDAPVLDNETVSTNEDTPLNGDLTDAGDTDPDSTALTANTVPVVAPTNGSIIVNANGTYTYSPNLNFNGSDIVVVSICDTGTPLPMACTNDTINITVTPVNDTSVIVNDTLAMVQNTTFNGSVINADDFDIDTTALTANPVAVLNPSHGAITINVNGTYSYTPVLNYFGPDTAIISVCDAGNPLPAICVNDTLFIEVFPFNTPPVIANDTITVIEDITYSGTIITSGDYDPDSLALMVNTTPVVTATNGTIVMNVNGTYTYTPNTNFNGSDIAVYSVCDAGAPFPECVNDTLYITVTAVNDTTVIANDFISVNEDDSVSSTILTAADFDPDTTVITVNIVPLSGPSNGLIVMNGNGSYTYTPDPGFNGLETIVFNVCDAGSPLPSICVNDTLFVTVNPVNDAPVITNDTISTDEDNLISGTILTAGDFDPDSTALTVSTIPLSGPDNGTIVIFGNGTFTYTPDPDFNGIDTIVIQVCDAGNPLPAICVNDTLIVTVNAINDAPVAVNDNAAVCSGSTIQINALVNDSDVDLDSIFISSIVQPANGTATTDGLTISYNPNPGYHGADSLVYTVCDNSFPQGCSSTTVYISVNGPVSSGIIATEVLCFGDSTGSVTTSAFLLATFTYLWNTGAVTPSIFNVPAGFYSVTITDSLGCSIVDTATVYQPELLVVTGSTTNALCYSDNSGSVNINVNGGTPAFTYLWSNGDTTQNLTGVNANTYIVNVTDNNGCISTYSGVVAQPASALSVNAIIDTANCLNNVIGNIDLTVSGGTTGYTYSWNNGPTTEDISAAAGSYTVVITDANSCTNSSTFIINDNSTLIITPLDSVSFCQGDSSRLSSAITTGTFQWLANGINIPGANDSIYVAYQSASYTMSLNNACGTYTSNAIDVVTNAKPIMSISGGLVICEGSNTQLNASGANTYSWLPSTGLNDATIGNPLASPVLTTDYTVTGNIGGCSSDQIVTVTVNPLPVITISATPFDCETGTNLQATGGVSYSWMPNIKLDNNTISSPVAAPIRTTTYTVTVIDSLSCINTQAITINSDCDGLVIPNGITPDGDGVNDFFQILGLRNYENNSLQVFNRWGNLVYKSKPYNNDWDGKCLEKGVVIGDKLPDGTYYYILELGDGFEGRAGFVEIRR